MARKKTITKDYIISSYMEYVLEHNAKPHSIHSFARSNNFEEIKFYENFANFESLEQSIFMVFFDNTIELLEKNKDYYAYDTRNKLISFYYTFFEILAVNRSYVLYTLNDKKNDLQKLKTLIKLKQRFKLFIEHLNISLLEIKQETLVKLQSKALKESSWIQLLFTLKFWLNDNSISFEKTDIYIEKSLNAGFDLLDVKPVNSILDLGKFLYKEKTQMN
jgi:hypothetical protein